MSALTVTLAHRVRRADPVLFQEVGDEAVLLDLSSESYFGLDPVGCRVWQLLEGAPTLASVHGALCAEYDAAPERIRTDLLALVTDLAEAGLVTLA